MNSDEHFRIGGIVGFLTSCALQKRTYKSVDLIKAIIWGLIGGGAALIPDILESSTSPNHRKFFHSIGFGVGIIKLNNKIRQDPNISDEIKNFLFLLSLSYGGHLLADATTPKGLPLI